MCLHSDRKPIYVEKRWNHIACVLSIPNSFSYSMNKSLNGREERRRGEEQEGGGEGKGVCFLVLEEPTWRTRAGHSLLSGPHLPHLWRGDDNNGKWWEASLENTQLKTLWKLLKVQIQVRFYFFVLLLSWVFLIFSLLFQLFQLPNIDQETNMESPLAGEEKEHPKPLWSFLQSMWWGWRYLPGENPRENWKEVSLRPWWGKPGLAFFSLHQFHSHLEGGIRRPVFKFQRHSRPQFNHSVLSFSRVWKGSNTTIS